MWRGRKVASRIVAASSTHTAEMGLLYMVVEPTCWARTYYIPCIHAREALHLYAHGIMHYQSYHLTKHFHNYDTNTVDNFYLFSTTWLSGRGDKEVASLNAATPHSVSPSSLSAPFRYPLCDLTYLCSATPCARYQCFRSGSIRFGEAFLVYVGELNNGSYHRSAVTRVLMNSSGIPRQAG